MKSGCYKAESSQQIVGKGWECENETLHLQRFQMTQMIKLYLQSEVSLNGTCSLLYEGLSNNDSMLLLILHPAVCAQDHFPQSNKPSPFERMAVLHDPNPAGVGQHRSPPLTKPNTASTLSCSYWLFLSQISAVNTEASSSPSGSAGSRGTRNRWSIICQDRRFVK